jgi:CHAD domain-containing protein
MATKTEVERKYDVPVGFAVPELTALPGVSTVSEPVERRLDATYFDTAELRLAANRITLRRRTGGADAGWHVKHPVTGQPDARTELQLPLGRQPEDAPVQARDAVREATGGAALKPVARIRTYRMERSLRDGSGRVLALLPDDLVSSNAAGERAVMQRWRELEAELVDGGPELLDALDRVLREAGACPAQASSKLARALADRYPSAAMPAPALAPDAQPDDGVLDQYVRSQVTAIRGCEPGARRADPDAIHDMRVAVRRLRSTLRTFRPLLDRDRSEPLRDELQWLGGVLGGVRDAQVMCERLLAAVAAEPPELVVGPVADRIRSELASTTEQAHRRLTDELDGVRYQALLAAIDEFTGDQLPERPSPRRLHRLARKALRRADDKLRNAMAADPAERDVPLHETRKAYKRARYAVETLVPLAGKPARRLAKRLSALQDVLGAHQDSVITGQLLRDLGIRAHADGDNAFTFGLLHARQHHAGQQQFTHLKTALRRADRRKVRGWLDNRPNRALPDNSAPPVT